MFYSFALKVLGARRIHETLARHSVIAALFGTLALGAGSAHAQGSTTDIVTVTIGYLPGWEIYNYGFDKSPQPQLGSVSPQTLSNGYPYYEIDYENYCAFIDDPRPPTLCAPFFLFQISASADPGQSFLTSISNATATLQGSAASYSYDPTSQIATWTFGGAADPFGFQNASSVQLTIVHN